MPEAERGAAALRAEAYNLALGAASGTDPAGTTTRKRDGSDARSSARWRGPVQLTGLAGDPNS